MRRTLILTAVGAATLTIGLGVGATLATGSPAPDVPTSTTLMMGGANGNDMHDGTGTGPMMGTAGMDAADMAADKMTEMHATMRIAMIGSVSADQLAACDAAHTSMMAGSSPTTSDTSTAHEGHHQGSQP